MGFKEMRFQDSDWIHTAEDSGYWQALVSMVMNLFQCNLKMEVAGFLQNIDVCLSDFAASHPRELFNHFVVLRNNMLVQGEVNVIVYM